MTPSCGSQARIEADAAQRGGQAELQEAVAVYEEQLAVLQATAAGQDAAIEASARASELSHKRYADGLQMCSGGAKFVYMFKWVIMGSS